MASSARAHGHPLYPPAARSGCGRGQFSSPCRAASGGTRNLRARQHRAGWQDPAWQFRQLSGPCRRPGVECLRHRYGAGTGAYRYRREVKRDSGGAEITRRTRAGRRGNRHNGCSALPKKTFEVAANTALIVQVKDNPPPLNQKIQEIASTTAPIDAIGSRTKGRNRDERRTVTVFDPAEDLATTEWHPHVAAIVCVERKVFTRIVASGLWDWSTETAFYVSNTMLTAVHAADAIRGHWKIETTSHYSRDVTFGEDKSRIRSNPGVFARLRSFAFNILKSSKTSTLCQDRYRAALAGIDNLLEVLAIP